MLVIFITFAPVKTALKRIAEQIYQNLYQKKKNMAKELTSRSENYSQWYNDLVVKADLAENSAVRGCMVIKPYGYEIGRAHV